MLRLVYSLFVYFEDSREIVIVFTMSTIGFHLADRYEPRAYGNGSHPHKQPGVLRASCPFAHTSQTCADEGTGGGTLTTI